MDTITIQISQNDVYEEVAKITDYTWTKLADADDNAQDRILATDDDLAELGRFWEESVVATNENLKEMLISGSTKSTPATRYEAVIEVSKSFDKALTDSVQSTLRSFFIASIVGQWFKFANKGESEDYFTQAADLMIAAERLLYSRKKPTRPND